MPRINNKIEVLRSLERTKEQFEVQYRENCDGTENGAYPEFSDADLEFMESFQKIYQLGITQLQNFVNDLDERSDEIDEYSILYYISQLSNGPYANYFRQFTANRGPQSIYAPSNDQQAATTHSIKSNSTVPVFRSNSSNAGLGIFNKSTGFIQNILREANTQTSRIFDFNFQSSIYDDNTLPFIDKAPTARANAELNLSFGAAPLGIGEIYNIGPRFVNAATSALENIASEVIGKIAIAGNNEIVNAIQQIGNLNPKSITDSVLQSVTRSVIQNANNGAVDIIQQGIGGLQQAGNGIARDLVGSLNQAVAPVLDPIIDVGGGLLQSGIGTALDNLEGGSTGFNTTVIGGIVTNPIGAIGQIGTNLLPNIANTAQGIVQNAGNILLGSGTSIMENSIGQLGNNLQTSLQGVAASFSNLGVSLNSISLDNIIGGAVDNLKGIGQGIVTNAAGSLGAKVGQALGGKGTLLGSFAIGYVSGLFGGKRPQKPSQAPVNALGGGGSSWSPGTANSNYMIKDIKMHNIISEATEDIMKSLESSLGAAFRLLVFKKTLNYFNAEENESFTTDDPITRLLTFIKKVRNESGNEQFKQECVEIETSLLGNATIGNRTNTLQAYYSTGTMSLYTNTGRLGTRPLKPEDEDNEGVDDAVIDDRFDTPDDAIDRADDIGCQGYHTHTEDGTTYYMPCSSMDEYCELTGNCPDKEDPESPLTNEVDCEEVIMITTTTPNPNITTTTTIAPTTTTLRPSPFVDVISALSQPGDQYYAGSADSYPEGWVFDEATGTYNPPIDWVFDEATGDFFPPGEEPNWEGR